MELSEVSIQKGSIADIESIVRFQLDMAWETEELRLDRNTVTAGVKRLFDEPQRGFYLVAMYQETIISSMLVLYEWSDWRNGEVLWVHSLFVEKPYRRKGVFRKFYDHLQKQVNETPAWKGLRLYVEKTNTNAQKAYRAVGMTNEHYELYEWLKEY